jgi:hypothetical protein
MADEHEDNLSGRIGLRPCYLGTAELGVLDGQIDASLGRDLESKKD